MLAQSVPSAFPVSDLLDDRYMAIREVHVVFEDFPGPEKTAVFVEVEDAHGRSINIGEWRKREDGYAALVLHCDDSFKAPDEPLEQIKREDLIPVPGTRKEPRDGSSARAQS